MTEFLYKIEGYLIFRQMKDIYEKDMYGIEDTISIENNEIKINSILY